MISLNLLLDNNFLLKPCEQASARGLGEGGKCEEEICDRYLS